MKTVTLMTGTNVTKGKELLNNEYNTISWWSDNMETLAQYYEGCAIEIDVTLDPDKKQDYIRSLTDYVFCFCEYTYGFAEMSCPEGATWYSFSRDYLEKNVVAVREIFPDLSTFNEED